ncbi:hypothetical protein N7532_001850 [Penicillium argentinense]|uniref:Cation transporter n=1 Tax=Penicillium argentinense TaxID=1131581 RepID=A0A9W9KM65_9EURO|nr:uncharacterized protein N7532_001850 [Penicillium argentinense]KAJ5111315.1 hypothetical protein N7532_001850 [Penicillium argentinense]
MSLINTSMGPYQKETFINIVRRAFPLLVCGFLILAGNTLFPCLLRLFIWVLKMMLPNKPTWKLWHQTFEFTLAQSQKVGAYLYPAWHTWFILGTVLILNSIMWGAFEVAAIHNEEIRALPVQFRVLDGLFQGLSVRGGGFTVVAFDRLPQGLLILYGIFLILQTWKSCFEHSSTNSADSWTTGPHQQESYISTRSKFPHARFAYQQFRSQFSHDIWWLSLAIILITTTESDHFQAEPMAFSTFKVIFETVSAYSCVGVSIGYPGKSYAFCGAWHTLSKLFLIAVAFRGRHRGISVTIDSCAPFFESSVSPETNRHVEEERFAAQHQEIVR